MPRLALMLIWAGFLGPAMAWGQALVVVRGIPLSGFGSIAATDFNGDGDQDLMVIGQRLDGRSVTGLYLFQGRVEEPIPRQAPRIVALYEPLAFPARKMISGHVAWGDADGDGLVDLLMTGTSADEIGQDPVLLPATDVFRHERQSLAIQATPSLPPLSESRGAWADIDGDGDLDLALAGRLGNGAPFTGIFRHDGRFGFSLVSSQIPQVLPSDLVWGDFDGDGDSDLVITGRQAEAPVTLLLRNDGSGTLTVEETGLPALYFGTLAAGDFDGDGRDDLAYTGGRLSPDLMVAAGDLYRSTPSGFQPMGLGLRGVFSGDAHWGDFDADGDLDLLLGGTESLSSTENQSILVYEQEAGSFSLSMSFRGVLFGPTLWYDYNGDGRLDILVSGFQGDALVSFLLEL